MAERADAQLTAEVLGALRRDTFLEPLAIQVVATDGVVTLTGSIETELNKKAVEDRVREVAGVREIRDHLTVMEDESSSRSDDDIRREVMEQLQADPTIDQDRFHVRSQFGRVFISGTAESLEERESVIAAIHRVPGVTGIDDRMEVQVPILDQEPGEL
jgi:osmotically-inducible protein OsmY